MLRPLASASFGVDLLTSWRTAVALLISLLLHPAELQSQVRIRQRVDLGASSLLAAPSTTPVTSAGTITYRASFSGGVQTNKTRIATFWAPCTERQDREYGGSASFEAPAQGGVFSARVLFSPAAPGSMVQTWSVDGVVFRKDSSTIACTNCTINLLPEVRLYPGFTLTKGFDRVMHGETISSPFALRPIDRLDLCLPPVWNPLFGTTVRITSGAQYGQFAAASGSPLGTTITCTAQELSGIRYIADGEEPESLFGTVTVEVSCAGITQTTSFEVWNQDLSVVAAPGVIAQGQTSIITVRRRMPDGSIVDLAPDNYVSFFNESPMPAGILISEDGSQRDPYYVDGTTGRASFAANIDDAIPDSFRVSISVSANEGTGRGSILVVKQLAEDHAPVIDRLSTSTGDTFFAIGSTVQLVGEFHDDDGDVISAIWSGPGIGGGPAARTAAPDQISAVSKSRTATLSPVVATVTLAEAGVYTYRLTVRDARGHETAEELAIEARRPEVTLALKDPKEIYLITSDPSMPSVRFEGVVRYAPPGATFHWYWKMRLWWTDPLGKKWEPTEPFVAAESNISPTALWSVDWGDQIVGGDSVVVSLRVVVNTESIDGEPIEHTFKVLGASDRIAAAYAGLTVYERAVMYHESRYRQFSSFRKDVAVPQYPLLNANRDTLKKIVSLDNGIMQINSTHQKENKFNIRHVWDWRKNRELGRAILEDARLNAAGLPGRIRANSVKYSDPAFRACPDFPLDSLQYLWREAFKRYNGGPVHDYWKWIPDNPKEVGAAGQWERIQYPPRTKDGKRENPPYRSSAYADSVWQIVASHPRDWEVNP